MGCMFSEDTTAHLTMNNARDKHAELDLETRCGEVVSHLNKLRINFLALDFDQTVIDIHTAGRFTGTISELSSHLRPMFFHLISAAYNAGIKVAIVTFSPQVKQISHVLEMNFPDWSHEILIRGRDRSWSYEGNGMKKGKQPYMASAVEELETLYDLEINKNTSLLVDDDPDNIQCALEDGVRALLLIPDESHLVLDDILSMP